MEKVIIISGPNGIASHQTYQVNDLLHEGWTVKSVTQSSEREYTNVVFVLSR